MRRGALTPRFQEISPRFPLRPARHAFCLGSLPEGARPSLDRLPVMED